MEPQYPVISPLADTLRSFPRTEVLGDTCAPEAAEGEPAFDDSQDAAAPAAPLDADG